MKKIATSFRVHTSSVLLISILVLSVLIPVGTSTQESTLQYSFIFDVPKVTTDANGYDHISIQTLLTSGDSGEPQLPKKGVMFPLPLHSTVTDIQISGERHSLGTGYLIEPGQDIISYIDTSEATPKPDPLIYDSSEQYPAVLFSNQGIHSFRGLSLLSLTLYPVQYQPDSGEIFYYTRLTITITTSLNSIDQPLWRGLQKDIKTLTEKIEPEILQPSLPDQSGIEPLSEDNYDLLILTTDALKNSFQTLADKHNETGVRTRIKTMTEVGSSTPEAIRTFIKNTYQTDGIEYVLLGGDYDVIPPKGLYAQAGGKTETAMPSDLYYACLDGTFNADGDSYWGESNDEVDLVADVYVGRASVNTVEEAQYFVSKSVAYIDAGVASGGKYIGRVVLAGEKLWDNPLTWGGDSLDELIGSSSNNGFTTTGFPSSTFQITKLYERDGAWTKADLMSQINNGVYVLNHLGHGNITQAFKMTNTDASSLTNSKYCFIYSQACKCGYFDDATQDCFAEYLTVKNNHGAFATVMNTREGWYKKGSTDGPSHRFNREFWDAIFNEGAANSNFTRFGVANQDSKEDNIYRIDEDGMRWCYYDITLFGDPALRMYEPMSQPIISIGDITGGLGIHADISNTGNANAATIAYTITVKGGALGLVNKTFSDDFGPLNVNTDETVNTRPFLGLGTIRVTVTAGVSGDVSARKTTTFFILGIFVLELPERLQDLLTD